MADPLRAYPGPSDEPPDGEALERRVRRLEDAVAAIQDTQVMEDRVVERVVQRVDNSSYPQSASMIVSAARMLLPKTVDSVPENGPTPASENATPASADNRSPWMVLGVLQELRWILRMLTDYRYRMSWTGRIVLIAAIVVGFLSWFVIAVIPIIGGILDRIVLILAALVTYKAMSREVTLYQELMARLYRYR